jgi:hypothetical protein
VLTQAASGAVAVPEVETEVVVRIGAAGLARGDLAQELDRASTSPSFAETMLRP